jgi:hypothetical protein
MTVPSFESAPSPITVANPGGPAGRRFVFSAIVTVLGVCAIGLGAAEMYDWTLRAQVRERRLAPANSQLHAVEAEADAKLSRYQWVRQKDGVLRIPVGSARALVLARYAAPVASAAAARSGAH